MASNGGPDFQTDIANIPSAALTTVGFAQGLLRAVSTDNVNPLAVIQVQAIGACFQSNGAWAAKLPDLLSRSSSARLEKLSAWIGWAKGDTPSFMSQTAGGRTASLLCLALGSLYSKDRCGSVLFDISKDILPLEKQTSGLFQLGEVCMCLENKLACLGFGNHLGLQLTRVRQCFLAAELDIPRDLADTPTEEVMHTFLVSVRDVLCDENLILYYSGTQCAGPFLALVLAMCPDDVLVEVNGEVIARGCRNSIVFSIAITEHAVSTFYVERKLCIHTDDFRKTYIKVEGRHELNTQLRFSWDGMLSSQLDITLAAIGAKPNDPLKQAIANLVASTAISFSARDWNSAGFLNNAGLLPAQGLRVLLGPTYRQIIQERLERVLYRPSDTLRIPASEYKMLHDIAATSLDTLRCTCGICSAGDPWEDLRHPKWNTSAGRAWRSCPVSSLWSVMGHISDIALRSLFIQASPNSSLRAQVFAPPASHMGSLYRKAILQVSEEYYSLTAARIHEGALNLVGQWKSADTFRADQEMPPRICCSFEGSTIYPTTLEYPCIVNPWIIQYDLMDGKLYYGSDCYNSVICASTSRGAAKQLIRGKLRVPLLPKQQPIAPSTIGEHSAFTMTLRPAFTNGQQALILRCLIGWSSATTEVNFLDVHLGLMKLTPSDICEHALRTPFIPQDDKPPVMATCVTAPVASGTKAIGVTLTHRDGESQFLCCTSEVRQLYQGDCCISCAVTQAREQEYAVVIGGSPSTYLAAIEDK